MQIPSRSLPAPALVLVLAVLTNAGLTLVRGVDVPLKSDALYFLEIAVNLSEGHGYIHQSGTFWPGTPTMQRLPGWPGVLAGALALAPGSTPDVVARITCQALNVLVAVLIAVLAAGVTGRRVAGLVAGATYALHPVGLHFAYLGLSEPLFLVLVLLGLLCFMRGSWWIVAGLAFHGLACLVRANFILWLGLAFALGAIAMLRGGGTVTRGRLVALALGAVVFLMPPGAWLTRNHEVSGHFPVLSTLRGQTFYGGNNPLSAAPGEWWGHWVFPNTIPGETPLAELSRTMSEYEVDDYYFRKGTSFLRENPASIPVLLVGKLIRAYIPVPWKPRATTVIASAYRWLIYITAAAGIWMAWGQVGAFYRICLPSMFLANLAVVLLFYGYVRFAFAFEPFLLPFSAVALMEWWSRRPGVDGEQHGGSA